MKRAFKGIWIPREIWLSKNLSTIEKLFLTEIDSLDSSPRGCYASNSYFAEFFNITTSRCSQIINSLANKEFVKITMIRSGKEIKERQIRVVNLLKGVVNILNEGSKYIKGGYLENDKENNTLFNNTYINNTYRGFDNFLNSNEFKDYLKKNNLEIVKKNDSKDKIDYKSFYNEFNKITKKKFKIPNSKFKKQLKERLLEGYLLSDIYTAVLNCSKDKYHVENPNYLTPEFITRADKLEKYLNSTNLSSGINKKIKYIQSNNVSAEQEMQQQNNLKIYLKNKKND